MRTYLVPLLKFSIFTICTERKAVALDFSMPSIFLLLHHFHLSQTTSQLRTSYSTLTWFLIPPEDDMGTTKVTDVIFGYYNFSLC